VLAKLLLLFTVIPVVELYLLITIGQSMGAGPTIALVLGTGFLGAWLARREGSRVLRSWQGSLARGEIPKEGVISSVLVLVGGVLLVTPGVVTDVMGLVLLLPWTRRWVAHAIRRRLEQRLGVRGVVGDPSMFVGMGDAFGPGDAFGMADTAGPRGTVIDVDVVEAPPDQPEPRSSS
jgi:UPF0716 protein FxsA